MIKSFLKSPFGQALVATLYYTYCIFAFKTSRVTWQNEAIFRGLDMDGKPLIAAFWHGRMCYIPFWMSHPERTYVIISQHGDGSLIAKASLHFGVNILRGSTNRTSDDEKGFKDRGGAHVLRESIRLLKGGNIVSLTPDGPRGPRMQVPANLITLAKLTGAPIIPLTFSSSRPHIFKSWDRFMLPYPFEKVLMVAGNPIMVPRYASDEELEHAREELENQLNNLTQEADSTMGLTPIEPAKT